MAGDWRISADERIKYEMYFQQTGPIQGYLSGEQARGFFVKSSLPADILRRIWDLADLTSDGRLDKREFAIACHLISTQVQQKGPLPATLPAGLLADAMTITSNGISPLYVTPPGQSFGVSLPLKPAANALMPLTPTIRSKYLQQFHSIIDVTKTNGYMTGLQAKKLLQQTGLSQTLLQQIWNLSDNDKDGRLTADEFVIAMHSCDIARAGQTLPSRLPDDWSHSNIMARERTGVLHKPQLSPAFAQLNHELQDTFKSLNPIEIDRKDSIENYEDKRQKNYEDGHRELERRRQLLREQEEREIKEREERERKRELDLQKQKDDQERRKQLQFEQQLARQRQLEQQKEDERKQQLTQREAARKEMERKSRLEWERQRMQELSIQKSRLLEQINDLKSRDKALGLELQRMNETLQTSQIKLQQNNLTIQTIDQSIVDLQKRTEQEKHLYQTVEQQRKDLGIRLQQIHIEREAIDSSFKQLNQSQQFSAGQRESDQMRFLQTQIVTIQQENTRVDEQIITANNQCKKYQNQIEKLRSQLTQLEHDAITKISPPVSTIIPKHDPLYANTTMINSSVSFPVATLVDPFKTVDPFASQVDLGSPSPMNPIVQDPFLPTILRSPPTKKPAPKIASPTDKWPPKLTSNSNGKSSSIQYRALYDYIPESPNDIGITSGDIITVDPTKPQQDENWLFGRIGNGKEGFFPAAYAERIGSTSTPENGSQVDTSSILASDSWVIALADCQGKTADKHLSFQTGELILVQNQKDAVWYSGQLRGKIGWFPRNYVRPATKLEIINSTNSNNSSWINSPTSPNGTSSNGDGVADVYEAIYAYEATAASDLSFNVGEHIVVLERDGEWWTGQIEQRVGTFPQNFVKKLEKPSLETATAIAPFQTNEDGRLSFDSGQLIYIRKKGDKGWYQGEIRTPGQPILVGWFPAQCVQIQSVTSPTSSMSSYKNTTEYPCCISIFPYEAQQDDELSFPVNAIFEILDQSTNPDWFSARLGNQIGLIPSTYVQPIDRRNP